MFCTSGYLPLTQHKKPLKTPFNGSGSTGMAAVELGHEYIGCELDPNYVEIAKKRIEAWYHDKNKTAYNSLFHNG